MSFILEGNIITPKKILHDSKVVIDGDIIKDIVNKNDINNTFNKYKKINFSSDYYICPGLIDIHTHGALGKDFMDCSIESNIELGKFYLKNGVTSFLASTLTAPKSEIINSIKALKNYSFKNIEDSAELLGIHLEGPYLNKENPIFYGAQNPEFIRKLDLKEIDDFIETGEGLIKRITIAPETIKDSSEIIECLIKRKIIVSVGHSNANFDEAREAFNSGINLVTHFFNASGTWHHRATGIIGAAFLDKRVYCEVICDGHHVHPSAIEMAYIIKTPFKMITITDSTSGAGLEDGEKFIIGGQKAFIKNEVCRLESNNILAGSCLTLNKALFNIKNWMDISTPELVVTASLNPAKLLGFDNKLGSIEKGKIADIAVFNKDFKTYLVIKKGKIVYQKNNS